MTKIDYDMLVRDNYPSILERTGKKVCSTATIPKAEFLNRLADKLEEEVANFSHEFDAENDERALNKLADLSEVIDTILAEYGITSDAFARIREARQAMYGTFANRTLLLSVEDVAASDDK